MKQRLGVAAALLGEPELVVLDEPTNGLDPGGMADMRALVAELAREGRAVLLSSHLLAEVEEICDRVGVIAGGTLLAESTVAELRGGRRIRLVADPIDRAAAVAMRFAGDDAVQLDDGAVLVEADDAAVPGLVRALVGDGIDVREVTTSERTLEDVFFEMTKDHTLEAVS
jgi:ABC-2 type transport system ATP-binding protein